MLLISLYCCVDIFYIKFRFCETFTVVNSVTRILLIETLCKFRKYSKYKNNKTNFKNPEVFNDRPYNNSA